MTKEQLKRYREWKLELDEINDEINEKCIKGSVQGSMKDYPYILQNHKIGGVADADYGLLERKAEIKAQLKTVDDFVNGIKDFKIRKAIKMYYVEPIDESGEKIKWERIADFFNDGTTGESWRKKTDRYIKNNL